MVLPYVIEESGRKTRFSGAMEAAALLCIAEAERKKKPRLFGRTVENLGFISKLYYPLWAIPWENNSLLIDGMEPVSNNISYYKPPDIESFIEHLKRSTSVQELYHSALRSHRETFSDFISFAEIPMSGLITDGEMRSSMLTYIQESQAKKSTSHEPQSSLIQPKIDEKSAVKISRKTIDHSNRLQSEIKGLQFAIDTLGRETQKHVGMIDKEIKQTRKKYESRLSKVMVEVEQRREELGKEKDQKIEHVTTINKGEIDARLNERKRWERELLRLEQSRNEYERRKELRKRKNDEVGEARWEARLRNVQNQISTVKGKIKALSNFVDRSNKETEKTTRKLLDTYQKLIDKEEKKITDLKSLQDSEIEKQEKEREELQRESHAIIEKIERLIEQKTEHSSILKEATIPWELETPTLIHIPFYLVQYNAEQEKRYRFRPPSVARDHEGLVMKIRKTLRSRSLESRISALLKARSKALERLITTLEEKLKTDKGIERSLNQLGATHNLLTTANFKERAKAGMEELEVEGWIKPEEKDSILEIYAKG